MKTLILIASLLLTQFSYAKVLFCKQKVIPVKTEYTTKGDKTVVKYTAERTIKQFQIADIRGLDGLVISSKTTVAPTDLKRGEAVSITIQFTKPEGQVYLVTDIQGDISNKTKFQSLAIPVGELSAAQVQERKKNIKTLPSTQQKSGDALESGETKYHTMKLPE